MTNDLLYRVAIEMIPMVGSITAKRLLAYCGCAEAVFKAKKADLLRIPNIGEALAVAVLNQDILRKAEQELVFMQKNNIKALFYTDDDYPQNLKQCEDSPIILFQKGDIDLSKHRFISIVGTRNATAYGSGLCDKLIALIVERGYNPVIVSGLAYGIDVCAHKAAMKYGLKTVAIVGTGLDMVYPAAHRAIAKQITEEGAVLSDFPSNTLIDRKNFIRRNRIVSGISEVTIVVESGEKGGAMVTADIAASYNRDVLAFPGRVGDEFSAGCNKLIKANIAAMIESIEDLEAAMGWDSPSEKLTTKQLPLFDLLTADEMCIVNVLKENDSEMIDIIAHKTGLPMAKLSALLLNLEFSGYVKALPGKAYALRR
ncbi:MAG: DNA-processing protein DprA [Prevotellaceae bacterium]|jgi:DNA processing protein|nr:DNA-processing protein DprA [Prevotellaceae bacterium]